MIAARKNLALALGAVALSVGALATARTGTEEPFTGSDGQAGGVVEALRPGFEPWSHPLWEPPSGEIESLLFGLQAAIGAGALCYALGYWRGRRSRGGDRA